ncbi:hypothetical protein CPAR01_08886 [Colletotrichum paranaense]|uniref:Uncharacterized protein n=1 Tax=Colletotrichum paranaense TaxID=1914294 RepID=A0ABQ9SF56_9PEZI|nr:uncharacterized protein CPAR01_08886 [Colletotrichum paranaense]KAK1535344.1 hypothetical protein CPAR01_08886 [Colletotrichum paranaense]
MKFDTSIVDKIEIEKDGQVYKKRPAIWSEAFCRSLHHLSLHPIWAKNLGLLVTALQYASVLRTKNYQYWPLGNNTNDNFLAAFIDVIDKHKGQGKPLYELHGKTRERITKPACDSSLLSNLMLVLEEGVVPDPEAEPRGNGRKFRPYKISIQEINNLNRALANSTYRGRPRGGGFTPKEFAKITAHGRRPLEELPGESNIAELYERAILKCLRWEAKNKNQRARLNVPKTEPHRRPGRCEEAHGDDATEKAQLREELAASRRKVEEYRAELRAQSRSEAENQELKGRLETRPGDRSMMEQILQEEVDFTRRQYDTIMAKLRAPHERPSAEGKLQAENQELKSNVGGHARIKKDLRNRLTQSDQAAAQLETVQAEKDDLEAKLKSMEARLKSKGASARRRKKKNRKLEKKLESFRLQTEARIRVNEPSGSSDDMGLGSDNMNAGPESTNPRPKEIGNGTSEGGSDGHTEGGHNEPAAELSEAEILTKMLAVTRPKEKWRHSTEYYHVLSRDPLKRVAHPEYI